MSCISDRTSAAIRKPPTNNHTPDMKTKAFVKFALFVLIAGPATGQERTKPVAKADLLDAISSRLKRASEAAVARDPDFSSAEPLQRAFGLTPRVAETLLWLAQGKTNGDIAIILGISESTVKKHVLEIFEALQVETRTAACLAAVEALGKG